MDDLISAAEQEQLDEEGYVVIPDVLSIAEIESYRAQLLQLAEAERADGKARDGNPSLRYITLIRDGARAHGLPEAWISFLDRVQHAE